MPQRRSSIVALLLTCQFAISFVGTVIPVFATWVESHFGITKAELGLLFTVGGMGGAGSGLLVAWLSDRLPPRLVVALGLCVLCGGGLLAGLTMTSSPSPRPLWCWAWAVRAIGVSNAVFGTTLSTVVGRAADRSLPLSAALHLPALSVLTFGNVSAIWGVSARRPRRLHTTHAPEP